MLIQGWEGSSKVYSGAEYLGYSLCDCNQYTDDNIHVEEQTYHTWQFAGGWLR